MTTLNKVYFEDTSVTLWHGDALECSKQLADDSVNCIVTSPPYYGLRDYGVEGQYGLEASPAEYVETMGRLFSELRRVLSEDGTLWVNIGDSYSRNPKRGGSGTPNGRNVAEMGYCGASGDIPEKNLLGMPWRVAFALQRDGWILRNAIVWHKTNAMPESAIDRLSSRHEMVFMFSKNKQYWFNIDEISEPYSGDRSISRRMRSGNTNKKNSCTTAWDGGSRSPNPGDVWSMPTQPFSEAHFAVFPPSLPTRCILAGCKPGGTVLDPFNGSGTTGMVAQRCGRKYIGIELNREYLDLTLATRLKEMAFDL